VADLFGYQVKSGPSCAAFCVQQLGVPLVAFAGVLLVPNPFEWTSLDTVTLGSRIGAVIVYAAAAAIAGVTAAVAVRSIFGVPATGKWVWVIPGLLGIVGLVWDSAQFSSKHAFSELFLPGPGGEDWWTFLLFTCPTIACFAYSAVMHVASNSLSRNQAGSRASPPLVAR
jgi:hypothetical protein